MQQINNPRIIRAWTFYDWANSVYSLVIVSSVFPVYYQAITTGADGSDQVDFFGFTLTNSVLLSYAISFSFILVTPILPLLSGIADFTGKKKTLTPDQIADIRVEVTSIGGVLVNSLQK
mgnify:CR=1 FL=1